MLRDQPPCVAGPQLWLDHGLSWIVGWCVCIHRTVWDALGGWDEEYIISSWEDVDTSVTAVEKGYSLVHLPAFPFIHLDQRQRFTLPGYGASEGHNARYFARKHAGVTV
jgi:GT2 family glycosyltransferase